MHQVVELPARHRSAAPTDADLLRDGDRDAHYCDGVCASWKSRMPGVPSVNVRVNAWRVGTLAVGIEPLNCASYVGELGANLAVGVELGPVGSRFRR